MMTTCSRVYTWQKEEREREKKTCGVKSEGKIHTPHVLSSVHTTLDDKKIYI